MVTWRSWVKPVLAALLIGGALGALGLTAISAKDKASEVAVTSGDLAAAFRAKCVKDRRFRLQYKTRAQVEKKALRTQARVNRRLSRTSRLLARGADRRTTRLLRRLSRVAGESGGKQLRLRRTIEIIPLRGYCRG